MVGIRILALSLLLMLPPAAHAQTQTITVTHTYTLGDNDSRNDARQLCFLEAKRKVLEKAGSYIESHVEVSMSQLTRDQVRSYSAAVLKVEVVREEFAFENGHNTLTLTVNANVDAAEVRTRLEAIAKDKQLQGQIAQQQQQITKLEERVSDLRRQLDKPSQYTPADRLKALVDPHEEERALRLRKESAATLEKVEEIQRQARERLQARSQREDEDAKMICSRITLGMTAKEAEALIGKPAKEWYVPSWRMHVRLYGREANVRILYDGKRDEIHHVFNDAEGSGQAECAHLGG